MRWILGIQRIVQKFVVEVIRANVPHIVEYKTGIVKLYRLA
jgi:hypothetical protein